MHLTESKPEIYTWNSYSGSFKVMHLGITEKSTRDCMCCTIMWALMSEIIQEVANEMAKKNCPSCQTHCQTIIIRLHFRRWLCAPIDSFFVTGSENMHSETGRSRSSKVIDFRTNQKRVCDFLSVPYSNLVPVLPRFRNITQVFCSENDPTPIPSEVWGCFRWTRSPMLGSARASYPCAN